MVKKMKWIDWVAIVLLIIGGINWGFVGLLDFNLVAKLFGGGTFVSRTIYGLVGISAIYSIFSLFGIKKK